MPAWNSRQIHGRVEKDNRNQGSIFKILNNANRLEKFYFLRMKNHQVRSNNISIMVELEIYRAKK